MARAKPQPLACPCCKTGKPGAPSTHVSVGTWYETGPSLATWPNAETILAVLDEDVVVRLGRVGERRPGIGDGVVLPSRFFCVLVTIAAPTKHVHVRPSRVALRIYARGGHSLAPAPRERVGVQSQDAVGARAVVDLFGRDESHKASEKRVFRVDRSETEEAE